MPDQSYNMTEHASSAKITLSQDSELKEINAVDNVDNAYLVLENTYCWTVFVKLAQTTTKFHQTRDHVIQLHVKETNRKLLMDNVLIVQLSLNLMKIKQNVLLPRVEKLIFYYPMEHARHANNTSDLTIFKEHASKVHVITDNSMMTLEIV